MDGPAIQLNRRNIAYILFLAVIAAAPPLSTDMYLAAIPHIADQWAVPRSQVNLSLVLWFVSYAAMLLLWGSLSDRFGRRPILLIGIALFVLASVACAASQNVWQLVIARIAQGGGAAGPSGMAMAICRDKYEGKNRQRILAWLGIVLSVMPMIAPLLGAFVMGLAGWRAIFLVQGVLGLIAFIISLVVYRETIAAKDPSGLLGLATRYLRLARNPNYMLANGVLGLMAAPFLGYIAFSPIAYITHFGLTEKNFSVLFGFNAFMSMIGAFSCSLLIRRFHEFRLLTFCMIGCVAAYAFLLFLGSSHWAAFAIGAAVFTFFGSVSRPLSNHVILEQVTHDIGAASSGIVFLNFLGGGICMTLATLDWPHPFIAFAVIGLLFTGSAALAWPFFQRRAAAASASHHSPLTDPDTQQTTLEESTLG